VINSVDTGGVYIAFPTSETLKPIYRGAKTQVNCFHTKIGISKVSFLNRRSRYMNTFHGELVFTPLVKLLPVNMSSVEKKILQRLKLMNYNRVGNAREWFNTNDRKEVVNIIYAVLGELDVPKLIL